MRGQQALDAGHLRQGGALGGGELDHQVRVVQLRDQPRPTLADDQERGRTVSDHEARDPGQHPARPGQRGCWSPSPASACARRGMRGRGRSRPSSSAASAGVTVRATSRDAAIASRKETASGEINDRAGSASANTATTASAPAATAYSARAAGLDARVQHLRRLRRPAPADPPPVHHGVVEHHADGCDEPGQRYGVRAHPGQPQGEHRGQHREHHRQRADQHGPPRPHQQTDAEQGQHGGQRQPQGQVGHGRLDVGRGPVAPRCSPASRPARAADRPARPRHRRSPRPCPRRGTSPRRAAGRPGRPPPRRR